MHNQKRKIGRPPIYDFAGIEVGGCLSVTDHLEKARRAALEYARRTGKRFSTRKHECLLMITRIE